MKKHIFVIIGVLIIVILSILIISLAVTTNEEIVTNRLYSLDNLNIIGNSVKSITNNPDIIITCNPLQKIGDADNSNTITLDDAIIVAKIANNIIPLPENICCVDVDKDKEVSEEDAIMIQQIALNRLPEQGTCPPSGNTSPSICNYHQDCIDNDPNTIDICINGNCENKLHECESSQECNDNNLSTNDYCEAGLCSYTPNQKLLYFVDDAFYSEINNELDLWIQDLNSEGIYAQQVIINKDINPSLIRERIKEEYYLNGLDYVVLIGDVPYVYSEISYLKESISDRYFADMDTNYNLRVEVIPEEDIKYFYGMKDYRYRYTQINELVVSRILPPRGYSFIERKEMLETYFNKVHTRRNEYNEYYDQKVALLDGVYANNPYQLLQKENSFLENNELYTSLEEVDGIVGMSAQEIIDNYKLALNNNYELFFINIHGGETSQGTADINGNQEILFYTDLNETIGSAIYFLFSCNNGDISAENYFAGELLFKGGTLQVYAFSRPTSVGTGNDIFVAPEKYYMNYLNNGGILSYFSKLSYIDEALLVFGDPTLKLRNTYNFGTKIQDLNEFIDFGLLNPTAFTTKEVYFQNLAGKNSLEYINIKYDSIPGNSVSPPFTFPVPKQLLIQPSSLVSVNISIDDTYLRNIEINGLYQYFSKDTFDPFYYTHVKAMIGTEKD